MQDQDRQNTHQLSELIRKKYDTLSRSQKDLAKLILADPSLVCTCTTLELADKAGVSNATVVRFAATLGFSGYAALQKQSRQVLLADRYLTKIATPREGASSLEAILARQTQQLANSFSRINPEDFAKVADSVIGARRILVTGVRAVLGPAYFLARMLDLFFCNGTFLPHMGEGGYEEIFKADSRDLFICMSMSRYSRQTYVLTELAAKQGLRVVAITDSPVSPVARLADVSVIVGSEEVPIISSILGLTALVEALLYVLAARPEVSETIRANLNAHEVGMSSRIFFNES